jgi:hypothetical protein
MCYPCRRHSKILPSIEKSPVFGRNYPPAGVSIGSKSVLLRGYSPFLSHSPFFAFGFLLLENISDRMEVPRDDRQADVPFETPDSVIGATIQPSLLQRVDRGLHSRVLPASSDELFGTLDLFVHSRQFPLSR